MQSLDLDFLKTRRPAGWPSWALLVIATLFVADLGRSWFTLKDQIARQESRLATRSGPLPREGLMKTSIQPLAEGEYAAARDAVRRLSIPWNGLFGALEAAQTPNTALLSIEPDGEQGRVTITGEAKDYLAALSYVANLENQKALVKVHLDRHELKQSSPQRPVQFVVSAAWRQLR